MVDILRNLHEWVPDANENGEEIFDGVPVVGDQKNNGGWNGGPILSQQCIHKTETLGRVILPASKLAS